MSQLSMFSLLKHFYRIIIYLPILRLKSLIRKKISYFYLKGLQKKQPKKKLLINIDIGLHIFNGLLEISSERLHNGYFFESKKLSEHAFELREQYRNLDEEISDEFHPEFYGAIGHIASGIGMHAKILVSGFSVRSINPLAARGVEVANSELVEILSKLIQPRQKISLATKRKVDWPSVARLNLWSIGNNHLPFYWATAEIEEHCKASATKPLLIPQFSWFESAIRDLAQYGFSADDWFIGLHVREAPRDLNAGVTIQDYVPLMREITSSGGWVLRIGSPSAQPLPSMPNVIDLTQPHIRNSQNHMFALSFARAFIASQSGPLSAPSLFGVPTLWTNAVGLGIMPYLNNVVALPIRFLDKGGNLVDQERHALSKWALLDRNPNSKSSLESWLPQKNSPQDILSAYKFMTSDLSANRPRLGHDFAEARAQVCPYRAPDSIWIA